MKYFKIGVIIILFFVTSYLVMLSKSLIEENGPSAYEDKWRVLFFLFSLVCFTLNILIGIQANNRWGFSKIFEYAFLPIIPFGVFSWLTLWKWENPATLDSGGFFGVLIVCQMILLLPLLRTRKKEGDGGV